MDAAKRALGGVDQDLAAWARSAADPLPTLATQSDSVVTVGGRVFRDNTRRLPLSAFAGELHGDALPDWPTVLTGGLTEWEAFSAPGHSWSVADLAARTDKRLSLDGGRSPTATHLPLVSPALLTCLPPREAEKRPSQDTSACQRDHAQGGVKVAMPTLRVRGSGGHG
jgi:hypothetical protein